MFVCDSFQSSFLMDLFESELVTTIRKVSDNIGWMYICHKFWSFSSLDFVQVFFNNLAISLDQRWEVKISFLYIVQ